MLMISIGRIALAMISVKPYALFKSAFLFPYGIEVDGRRCLVGMAKETLGDTGGHILARDAVAVLRPEGSQRSCYHGKCGRRSDA
jgi:hypothetical protein